MKTLGIIALIVALSVQAKAEGVLIPLIDSAGNTNTVEQTLAGDATVTSDGLKTTLAGESND